MRHLLIVLIAICATHVHAGANNAALSCQATNVGGSGITLKGEIPVDFAEFQLTLANRHGELTWSHADGTAQSVVAFGKGVFTLTLQLKDGSSLALYAIPSSVKAQGGDRRLVDAHFDAMLMHAPRPGFDPKSTLDANVRNVPMRCHFHHGV
jgi:hypothetical protein